MEKEINTNNTQDSSLRHYQRHSSSSSGNSSISRIVAPETFSTLSNGKSNEKYSRISNAEDIRKNSPVSTTTFLDLSYCKNLRIEGMILLTLISELFNLFKIYVEFELWD